MKTTTHGSGIQVEYHEEHIECPECNTVQTAKVEHTDPFWSYVHHCEKCKYIIMESEWWTLSMDAPIQEN